MSTPTQEQDIGGPVHTPTKETCNESENTLIDPEARVPEQTPEKAMERADLEKTLIEQVAREPAHTPEKQIEGTELESEGKLIELDAGVPEQTPEKDNEKTKSEKTLIQQVAREQGLIPEKQIDERESEGKQVELEARVPKLTPKINMERTELEKTLIEQATKELENMSQKEKDTQKQGKTSTKEPDKTKLKNTKEQCISKPKKDNQSNKLPFLEEPNWQQDEVPISSRRAFAPTDSIRICELCNNLIKDYKKPITAVTVTDALSASREGRDLIRKYTNMYGRTAPKKLADRVRAKRRQLQGKK